MSVWTLCQASACWNRCEVTVSVTVCHMEAALSGLQPVSLCTATHDQSSQREVLISTRLLARGSGIQALQRDACCCALQALCWSQETPRAQPATPFCLQCVIIPGLRSHRLHQVPAQTAHAVAQLLLLLASQLFRGQFSGPACRALAGPALLALQPGPIQAGLRPVVGPLHLQVPYAHGVPLFYALPPQSRIDACAAVGFRVKGVGTRFSLTGPLSGKSRYGEKLVEFAMVMDGAAAGPEMVASCGWWLVQSAAGWLTAAVAASEYLQLVCQSPADRDKGCVTPRRLAFHLCQSQSAPLTLLRSHVCRQAPTVSPCTTPLTS